MKKALLGIFLLPKGIPYGIPLKYPKNGHFTLLNTCINWGGSDFGGTSKIVALIIARKLAKKSALGFWGFWVPKRGGPKRVKNRGFLGFFRVF